MSSTSFEAELRADERGRQVLVWSGIVLAVAGAGVIVSLPLSWAIRATCLAVWMMDTAISLCRLRRGFAACDRITVSALGDIRIHGPDDQQRSVILATGSLILPRFAWLRYTTPGGPVHAECLLRGSAEDLAWHRLQVIWRLGRAAFGQRRAA